ncbi:MAG: secretin N-terminal domain-containing protein [Desulfobacterales bacterium]
MAGLSRLLTPVCVGVAVAVMGAAWQTTAGTHPEPVVEIVPLVHRTAKDLLPLLRPLSGPEGHVSADSRSNRIVIVDTPDRVRTIQRLIRQIDQPVKRFRVALQVSAEDSSEETSVEADGRIENGDGSVEVGSPGPESGIRVRGGFERQKTLQSGEYSVVLDSGGSATILVGRDVPYRSEWEHICRRKGLIARGVEFEEVGTGFHVKLAVFGKQARLDLSPTVRFVTRTGSRRVQPFADAQTSLTIPLGLWIEVAGAETQTDALTRAVLKSAQGAEGRSLTMKIRVDPM